MSTVAETIAAQIGSKALLMIGAHRLVDHGDALGFGFRGSRKANFVKITLTPMDVYRMEFYRVGRSKLTKVETVEDVYWDSLRDVIEQVTGLRTSL